jgi:hypothetical protein
MQAHQLLQSQEQETSEESFGNAKVLPTLQKACHAQRNEII